MTALAVRTGHCLSCRALIHRGELVRIRDVALLGVTEPPVFHVDCWDGEF